MTAKTPVRVLIVEDVDDDAALMLLELTGGGYAPSHQRVETPEAMSAALEREPWDLVLSDQSMPGFDATAALQQLRDRGLDIPFIVVSGSIDERSVIALMKGGACDYITKSSIDALVPAVDRALRDARERAESKRAAIALRESEQTLKEQLSLILRQEEAIRALSTPLIEVWDGVLMVPVLGVLDAARAQQMMESLLEAVRRTGCHHAIIDLTGVASMDATAAEHVMRLARAALLLGARGVVVGIRPEVAQAIVSIGADLTGIETLGSVRDALMLCMAEADPRGGR